MSTLLRKSFQNLEVTNTQPSSSQENAASAPPKKKKRVRMKLELPADKHSFQFYGFPVSREWLMEYARNTMTEDQSNRVGKNESRLIYFALVDIKYRSRIDNLMVELVVNPGDAPQDCLLDTGEVRVLSVCSNEREQYKHRPAQEDVDYLANLLGKQPRWWYDSHDQDYYL